MTEEEIPDKELEDVMEALEAVGDKAERLGLRMVDEIAKEADKVDDDGNPILDERQLKNMGAQTMMLIQQLASLRKQEIIAEYLGVNEDVFLAYIGK